MAQAVARERRVHDDEVGWLDLADFPIAADLFDAGGPRQQQRLPFPAEEFQRAEIGRPILHAEQGAPDLHFFESGRRRNQAQGRRRQMRRRQVDIVTGQDIFDEEARDALITLTAS